MPNSDLELKNLLSGSNASSLDPKTKTCVRCYFVRIEQFWARLVFEETEQKTILRQSIRSFFLSGATGANIDREITSLLLRAVDLSYGRVPKRYKKWIQTIMRTDLVSGSEDPYLLAPRGKRDKERAALRRGRPPMAIGIPRPISRSLCGLLALRLAILIKGA